MPASSKIDIIINIDIGIPKINHNIVIAQWRPSININTDIKNMKESIIPIMCIQKFYYFQFF
jgi:hypothetical protein